MEDMEAMEDLEFNLTGIMDYFTIVSQRIDLRITDLTAELAMLHIQINGALAVPATLEFYRGQATSIIASRLWYEILRSFLRVIRLFIQDLVFVRYSIQPIIGMVNAVDVLVDSIREAAGGIAVADVVESHTGMVGSLNLIGDIVEALAQGANGGGALAGLHVPGNMVQEVVDATFPPIAPEGGGGH